MSVRIAITDDSAEYRWLIAEYIRRYMKEKQSEYEIRQFQSAEELLGSLKDNHFDIVFLDIFMHGMNGMDAAKFIFQHDPDCKIIFMSSSEEYARQSYSVRAVYYLVKPIIPEFFRQAMDFCHIKPSYAVPELTIRVPVTEVKLDTSEILYVDVEKHNTKIHTTSGIISIYESFSKTIEPLAADSRFLLCGRGLLVNMQNVADLNVDKLVLYSGEELPVSVRSRNKVKNAFEKLVGEKRLLS